MEHEISLALPNDSHALVRAWLTRQAHTTFTRSTMLLNVYFDTPAFDLKRQKAALRLRFDSERSCWIQTLKTAGERVNGVHVRHEWESVLPQTLSTSADIVPMFQTHDFSADAQSFLHGFLTELRPVFRTDFTREIYDFEHDGQHFEWAFDDGAVVRMDAAAQTAIHELELEYKSGNLELMRQMADQAQMALHAQAQTLSKAARGYALI